MGISKHATDDTADAGQRGRSRAGRDRERLTMPPATSTTPSLSNGRPAPSALAHRFTHHGTFGNDRFGVLAERFARFFGTPRFIIAQTVLVALWIIANAAAFGFRWDPYPFILLNLAFSTQAAYAAPLILLAQTRQAERDRILGIAVQAHRDAQVQRERAFEARQTEMLGREQAMAKQHLTLLAQDTGLTEQIGPTHHRAAHRRLRHRDLRADYANASSA